MPTSYTYRYVAVIGNLPVNATTLPAHIDLVGCFGSSYDAATILANLEPIVASSPLRFVNTGTMARVEGSVSHFVVISPELRAFHSAIVKVLTELKSNFHDPTQLYHHFSPVLRSTAGEGIGEGLRYQVVTFAIVEYSGDKITTISPYRTV